MATTADLGAGAAGAGSSLAGYGTPATATAPIAQSFATGASVSIDLVKRDYAYDANGNRLRMTAMQQNVYLALLTVRGSSAVSTLGMDAVPSVVSSKTTSVVKQAVYRALVPFTSTAPPQIQIVSADVTRKTPASLQLVVVWRDLTTRQESTTTVPLGG